ncbi:iron-siderophore ABC transporter substrate-binding protein [Paramicrobacterium sp. CJ85]|uniref:iron-siderophore ABC transporter substrate-binding protein n=1 Tax=Paramicrobacterium sp. CJ85 TaxID=3445355 RepID=UPI003F62DFDF
MKKLPALVAALAVSALALTGCSSGQSGSDEGTADPSGAFPVTVNTKFGEVTVEEQPERVVALGWGDAAVALELGVRPVGASDWLGFGGTGVGPWDADKYDEAPKMIDTLEPNYEEIAALHPDLILDVRSSGDTARHDKLSDIATTIGVSEDGDNYLTSPEDQVTMIATALGKADEGKALLDEVSAKFAEVADAHPDWKGKSVTVATRTSEGWGAYIEGDSRLSFLQNLGFTQSPTIADLKADATGFSTSISDEQLDLLDADLIVAFPIFIDTTQITEDAQWKAIPAVADDRAVVVDGELSQAFSAGTPGAQLYALDKLVPLIEKTSLT